MTKRDLRDAARILCSRAFWREFHRFWFDSNRPTSLVARMDEWVAHTRENTGQDPDWEVEHRRARRRVHRDD